MRVPLRFSVSLISLLALFGWALAQATSTELGVQGSNFTVNQQPTFLYGLSYYGGLGAPEDFVRHDLDDMRHFGFNWLRVWATWGAFDCDLSAVNANDGQPRPLFFDKLIWLITECDRRGMVVDVTLGKGDGIPPTQLATHEQHRRVVTTLVTTLKSYRNWYLDLSNERNIRDKRFSSFQQLKELRNDVKGIDVGRLVTASHGGDITRDDLRDYLETAQVDFITPHRPRDPASPRQTERITCELLAWMKELERTVPVHYQEPFRRGYGNWAPKADDFVNDAIGAKAGGAAGWCFHNGSEKNGPNGKPRRSFDLRETRLFDQLDDEERTAIKRLQTAFLPTSAAVPP